MAYLEGLDVTREPVSTRRVGQHVLEFPRLDGRVGKAVVGRR